MELSFYTSPLSYIFVIYFTSLVLLSLLNVYATVRGLFYSFIVILFALLIYLIYLIDAMLLYNQTFSLEFLLVAQTSLFPEIGLSFYFDSLSFCFTLLVITIGFFTNIYILNYFKYEANEDIFFLLINWFILSMLCLVLANNLFTLFLGWELIGLTSFFLINFWSERRGTLKSSFKAFSFNKVSDFFLFVFIILIWHNTHSSNISYINFLLETNTYNLDTSWYILGYSLLFCSSIKSAQLFGHLWLPDSMEAPVPASALIHSATLVSAGLYLLLRFNVLVNLLDMQYVIIFLGSITAAYGGIVAATQTDVKKLLAYSTISHCGFLYVCAGFQNFYLVIIYLFLHGLFKALTFFCVGSFIRVANSQDTRFMGILNRYLPVDTIFLIICASNLAGLPFTLGYLYKNFFILMLVNSNIMFLNIGLCFIGMLTSVVYVYRLIYYCAFDVNKNYSNIALKTLSTNRELDHNNWSASTIVMHISIFLMLFVSLYLYIILFSYFQYSNLFVEAFPLYFISDLNLTESLEQFYSFYINFFYILYTVVVCIILLIECRSIRSWDLKLTFMTLLLIFFFILLFFF